MISNLEYRMKKVVVLFILSYLAAPVNAVVYHFFDGEKLLEAAQEWEKSQVSSKDADLLLVAGYAGYVGAMFDHLSEAQHICANEGLTKNEVLKVVADHIKANSKNLEQSGSVFIEKALYKEYVCK